MTCPHCASQVPETAIFCPNCGKRLKEKEAAIGMWALIWLFFVSIFLPPFGLGLTIRYLRSADRTAKAMGVISLAVTLVVLGAAIWSAVSISKNINQMVNQQLGF